MCPQHTKISKGGHHIPRPPPPYIIRPCPQTLLPPPYTVPPYTISQSPPPPHIPESGVSTGNNSMEPEKQIVVDMAMFERLQQSVSHLEEMVAALMSRQNKIDHYMELNVPCFDGSLGIEEFLDWLDEVEAIFDYMGIAEDMKVKLIACKLKRGASAWWQHVKSSRVRENKSKIESWQHMKQLMIARFLPIDYKDILYRKFLNCRQGDRSVQEYVDEFYLLSARNNLQESSEYLIAKFIDGLRDDIQDEVAPLLVHKLPAAIRLAKLIEQQMHENDTITYDEEDGSSTVSTDAHEGLCLLIRRLSDTKLNGGNGDQRHKTFQTICTINEVDCDLIIHDGCTTNIVSKSIVDQLHLKTSKHPSPYRLKWITKSEKDKVTRQCRVSFSVGKLYRDEVVCDVVDMDACDLLLGRPWSFDLKTSFNGLENTYTFYKDNKKIVLAPM